VRSLVVATNPEPWSDLDGPLRSYNDLMKDWTRAAGPDQKRELLPRLSRFVEEAVEFGRHLRVPTEHETLQFMAREAARHVLALTGSLPNFVLRPPPASGEFEVVHALDPGSGGADPGNGVREAPPPVTVRVPAPARARPVPAGGAGRRPATARDEAFAPATVLARFPTPVALAYQRFFRRPEHEVRSRVESLVKTLQATLRYLVFVGLSDLFSCLATARATTLPDFAFLRPAEKVTLGSWAGALRETARALAKQRRRFVRELPEVCAPGGRLDKELFGRVIAERNLTEHRGGDLSMSQEDCLTFLKEVRPRLEEALHAVRFLRDYPLGFVREGAPLDTGEWQYSLHPCVGTRLTGADEATLFRSPLRLVEGQPFIAAPDGTSLLYAYPFLFQDLDEHAQQPRLFVFEAVHKDGRFLSRVECAAIDRDLRREVTLAGPADSHAWLLERLRTEYARPPLPQQANLAQRLRRPRGGSLTGRQLGPNRLEAVIGRGAYGTVYHATTPAGQPVAVKVLPPEAGPADLKRFAREYHKLRQAGDHHGIVRCFEHQMSPVDDRDYPWFSMEFAAGGNLAQRIAERQERTGGRPPWDDPALRREVVREFRAVVEAVAHLHGPMNLIHRDVKPSNVLVMENGSLRLSDFGIVKSLDPMARTRLATSPGQLVGTPGYMAPEQRRGEVERSADVYSLGVLLAELATGEQPCLNPGVRQGSTLAGWSGLRRLPRPLAELIRKCTSADPAKRPGDAAALLERFDDCLRRLGVSA
jgi:hypothetical protein